MQDVAGFRQRVLALCVVLGGAVSLAATARADDWPQFLGASRDGISMESGLVRGFDESGPRLLWQTELGVGMSGIAVAGGQLLTMEQDEHSQYVTCLKADDGSIVWKTPVAPMYENGMGNGPRATPTVSGQRIYAMTGEGILVALARADGTKQWQVDVPGSLGGEPSEYGMSCSPLVVGEAVIVHAGADDAAVAAFNTASGKLLWTAGRGRAGYSSPILRTLSGVPQVLAFTATGLMGVDPASGAELWSFPFATDFDCNTANPVQMDKDHVLISAGENHGSALLRVSTTGSTWSVSDVWTSYGKDSQLRAEWQTPVLHKGHLYGLDNSGSAGPITNLVCIRASDGKTLWKKTRFGKSNLVVADGMLWLTTMDGELVAVEASPDVFRETGRAAVMQTTRQAPAIADGRLYVRDRGGVLCFDLTAASQPVE